jgi:hypothetical protein
LKGQERERIEAKEKEKKLREKREQQEKEQQLQQCAQPANSNGNPTFVTLAPVSKENVADASTKKDVVLLFKSPQASGVRVDAKASDPAVSTVTVSPEFGTTTFDRLNASAEQATPQQVSYTNTTTVATNETGHEKEHESSDDSPLSEGAIPQSLLLHRESYELLQANLQLIVTEEANTETKPAEEKAKGAPEPSKARAIHTQPKRTALKSSATSPSTSPPSNTHAEPIGSHVTATTANDQQSSGNREGRAVEREKNETEKGQDEASRPGSPGMLIHFLL